MAWSWYQIVPACCVFGYSKTAALASVATSVLYSGPWSPLAVNQAYGKPSEVDWTSAPWTWGIIGTFVWASSYPGGKGLYGSGSMPGMPPMFRLFGSAHIIVGSTANRCGLVSSLIHLTRVVVFRVILKLGPGEFAMKPSDVPLTSFASPP